jgi:hypothetical protein
MTWYKYQVYEDLFGHSGNIKVITLTITEVVMLIVLMRQIPEVRHSEVEATVLVILTSGIYD